MAVLQVPLILTWYLCAPFFRGFWKLLPDTGNLVFGLVFSAVYPDKMRTEK